MIVTHCAAVTIASETRQQRHTRSLRTRSQAGESAQYYLGLSGDLLQLSKHLPGSYHYG